MMSSLQTHPNKNNISNNSSSSKNNNTLRLQPYMGFLPLFPAKTILEQLPIDCSPELQKFIVLVNPRQTFHELAATTGIPLLHLYRLASHLVHWKKGRVIYPPSLHDIYAVNVDVNGEVPTLHAHSSLSKEFKLNFSDSATNLASTLRLFNGYSTIRSIFSTMNNVSRQRCSDVIVWLLERHLIARLSSRLQYVEVIPLIPTTVTVLGESRRKLRFDSTSEFEFDLGVEDTVQQLHDQDVKMVSFSPLFHRLKPYCDGQHDIARIMWLERCTYQELCLLVQQTEGLTLYRKPSAI
jgi:hypothetical protein